VGRPQRLRARPPRRKACVPPSPFPSGSPVACFWRWASRPMASRLGEEGATMSYLRKAVLVVLALLVAAPVRAVEPGSPLAIQPPSRPRPVVLPPTPRSVELARFLEAPGREEASVRARGTSSTRWGVSPRNCPGTSSSPTSTCCSTQSSLPPTRSWCRCVLGGAAARVLGRPARLISRQGRWDRPLIPQSGRAKTFSYQWRRPCSRS
jgi:hypothetical protein